MPPRKPRVIDTLACKLRSITFSVACRGDLRILRRRAAGVTPQSVFRHAVIRTGADVACFRRVGTGLVAVSYP